MAKKTDNKKNQIYTNMYSIGQQDGYKSGYADGVIAGKKAILAYLDKATSETKKNGKG